MTKASQIKDFTKGNITKQLFIFALPLFLSNLLQVVYNMVDMVIVGQTMGDVGLSAVSVGGDISAFMTFIAMGFANAGQVIISQYIGAKRKHEISKFISTMFVFLMICAIVISCFSYIFRNTLLDWMNAPEESYEEALAYSTVCVFGLVFIYGYNIISAVLRGMGDSKHPFIFISIAAILNLLLDVLFVLGLKMGAMGAALATVISQAVSFISCAIFLIKKRADFELDFHLQDFFQIDKEKLLDLIRLGTPMAIKLAAVQFSKLFVNSYINSYGVEVSGFAGVANKIGSISNLISAALNTAGSGMVGQNIAAGEFNRVKQIIRRLFAITLTIAVLLSAAIMIYPEAIFGIFIKKGEEALMVIALEFIPIAILLFFGSACRAAMNALINGSGNYRINFVTAILDGIVLRIGLALFFGIAQNFGYLGFWLGDALAGFTPFLIGIVFYFTGLWKKGNPSKGKRKA